MKFFQPLDVIGFKGINSSYLVKCYFLVLLIYFV